MFINLFEKLIKRRREESAEQKTLAAIALARYIYPSEFFDLNPDLESNGRRHCSSIDSFTHGFRIKAKECNDGWVLLQLFDKDGSESSIHEYKRKLLEGRFNGTQIELKMVHASLSIEKLKSIIDPIECQGEEGGLHPWML